MSLVEQAFLEFASVSWRVSWLIVLLAGLRYVFRRQIDARWYFAGWLLLAGALLIPARFAVPGSLPGFPEVSLRPLRLAESAPGDVARIAAPAGPVEAGEVPPLAPSPVATPASDTLEAGGVAAIGVEALSGVALVWLLGAGGLLSLRLIRVIRFHRRLARTGNPAEPRLATAVRGACSELGIGTSPAVVTTTMVESPALCGALRPRLLFPPDLAARLSADELRWVVLHELGHVRRRDLLGQTLLQLACVVHWYNPLVWLAARLARQDCEIACDAFVLRRARPADGSAYGRALLSVLGAAGGPSRLPAILGIVENKRLLFTRITMISEHRSQTLRRTLTGVAFLTTFAIVGYTEESKAPEATRMTVPTNVPGNAMSRDELLARRQAMDAERERWNAEAKVQLRAIGTPAGVPVAFLDVNDEPRLVIVGSNLLGAVVSEIDVAGGRVITVSRRDQAQRVFELREPRDIRFPEVPPQRIEQLLSTAPGVMPQSDRLAPEVGAAWPRINREGKEALLMAYLASGVVVEITPHPGGWSGGSKRLLAKQIEERNRARLEAFRASLTAEQRQDFGGGGRMAISLVASPDERAAQAARAAERQAKQDAVIAALTPEQRRLYDEWRAAVQR